jgi:hypothetical protein
MIPFSNNRQRLNHTVCLTILILATSILFPAGNVLAAANSGDWVKPGVSIIEGLQSGVVTIGALVIGLGVMVVGVWACATLRMEWSKLGYVLIGGILIMAGPTMVNALLELAT